MVQLAAVVCLGVSGSAPGQQAHPNVATGARSESLYVDNGSETVNVHNGNLSYVIPIGEAIPVGPVLRIAPKLVYNSHVGKSWQYTCTNPPNEPEVGFAHAPTGDRAFGAGWQLHFGRLISSATGWYGARPGACPLQPPAPLAGPTTTVPNGGMWGTGFAYLSADGAVHAFYDRQIESTTPLTGTQPVWRCGLGNYRTPGERCYGYTHDGSFLRLDPIDPDHGGAPVVYFPDGTKQIMGFAGGRLAKDLDPVFTAAQAEAYLAFASENVTRQLSSGAVEYGPWNTTEIRDPWGNSISVSYYGQAGSPAHPLTSESAYRRDALVYKIWDTAHPVYRYVQFTAGLLDARPVYTGISVLTSQMNGQLPVRANWVPSYENSPTEGYKRLSQLALPHGLTFQPGYSNVMGEDLLTSLTIPTGGRFEWDYGDVKFFSRQSQECRGGCAFIWAEAHETGVVARRAIRRVAPFGWAAVIETAQTNYVRSYDDGNTGAPEAFEMTVDVWKPAGDSPNRIVTRSRFHASDGLFRGAFGGRPKHTSDFEVPATSEVGREALDSHPERRFRETAFDYDFDGATLGPDPNAPGPDHNTRTRTTTTTWVANGREMVEGHEGWSQMNGHWATSYIEERLGQNDVRRLRTISETWLDSPPGSPYAWNLGLVSQRTTSRPEATGDPAGTDLNTVESYLYDSSGFRTEHYIQSNNPGDTRTLRHRYGRGTQPTAACMGLGSANADCGNLGFPSVQRDTLTGSLNSESVSSDLWRYLYYKHGALQGRRDGYLNFFSVDRDITYTGRVIGERGPEGRTSVNDTAPTLTTVTQYDLLGRIVSAQPPGEGQELFTYGAQDVLRAKKNLSGSTMSRRQTYFDQFGRANAERVELPGSVWSCRLNTFDAAGRQIGRTEWWKNGDPGIGTLCDNLLDAEADFDLLDPPGSSPKGTTWSAFDALDRATRTRLADGTLVKDAFEGWWQQTTSRQVNTDNPEDASVTRIQKDALGRVVSVTEPEARTAAKALMNPPETTTYVYDHADRLVLSRKTGSDSAGNNSVEQTRTRLYDDFGWLLSQSDPEQPAFTVQSRDGRGNPLRTWDGASVIIRTFDDADRVINSRREGETPSYDWDGQPATWYEVFAYDSLPGWDFGRSNGRLVWSIRANHVNTNRGTSEFGWSGITSFYHYNGAGGRLSFRQQSDYMMPEPAQPGPQTAEALGVSAKAKPLIQAFRGYFEKQGRMARSKADVLKLGATSERAAAATLGSPATPGGVARWSYYYDTAGRLSSITYPRRDEGFATTSTISYSSGFPTSIVANFSDPFTGGSVGTVSANLSYDATGRVAETSVSTSALGGGTALRLLTGRDPIFGIARPASWQLLRRSGSTMISHDLRTYAYDGSGNISSMTSTFSAPSTYLYDSRQRLVRDNLRDRGAQDRAYDGFGNLVSVTGAGAFSTPTDPNTNRLGGGMAEYDGAGRMTEDGSRKAHAGDWSIGRDYYPDGGLMTEFSHEAGSNGTKPGPGLSIWLLDGRGEAAFSFWGDNTSCETAKYNSLVRDEGARLMTEYHAEVETACTCSSGCVWRDRYHSDVVRLGPWATATYTRGTGIRLEVRDHLGTPAYVTDASGTPVSNVWLESFGQKVTGSGDAATREHFTSHERNHATFAERFLPTSDYMHARTYVPMLGRFTRPDPNTKFSLFNPQTLNRYSYVANNPVNSVDPLGLELVKLGQHSDEEIKRRLGEISQQLKAKGLSAEAKAALKAERTTLNWEKRGNAVVGGMLAKLDGAGQGNGLSLSNFTLSTDTRADFPGAPPAATERMLQTAAFVLQSPAALSGTIYVRTEPSNGFFRQAQSSSDYGYYGASALRHEQVHLLGNSSEFDAYSLQRSVLGYFRPFFNSTSLFGDLDTFLERNINAAAPAP